MRYQMNLWRESGLPVYVYVWRRFWFILWVTDTELAEVIFSVLAISWGVGFFLMDPKYYASNPAFVYFRILHRGTWGWAYTLLGAGRLVTVALDEFNNSGLRRVFAFGSMLLWMFFCLALWAANPLLPANFFYSFFVVACAWLTVRLRRKGPL